MTLDQITAVPHKTPIDEIQLRVQNVYGQKDGTSERGPWSLQNIICQEINDPSKTIKVLLKDREPFPHPESSIILIKARYSQQHGNTGVYAEDDTYNSETRRIIKVTKTGDIERLDNPQVADLPPQQQQQQPGHQLQDAVSNHNPQHQEPDIPWDAGQQAPPPQQQQQPSEQPPEQPAKPATSKDVENIRSAKRQIIQITNLHLLCGLALERLEAPAYEAHTGRPMSDSQKQGAHGSIFIKAERSGLVDRMPNRPFRDDEIA